MTVFTYLSVDANAEKMGRLLLVTRRNNAVRRMVVEEKKTEEKGSDGDGDDGDFLNEDDEACTMRVLTMRKT